MSRVLLNDPRVANKITENFVPVSGAIERLQPSRYGNPESASSRWFQLMAKAALEEYAPPSWWEQFQSYQGLYVVGADGTCYDYQIVWELPPKKYLAIMEQALAKFSADEPQPVEIEDAVVEAAAPAAPDPSTSVLRVFSRIGPVSEGGGIGRDHLWFFQDEVRELMQAAKRAGDEPFPMPATIAGRLVRFHLLDTTRNVSPAFSEEGVSKAEFTVRAISEASTPRFVFQGEYDSKGKSEESGEDFGMAGWLQGEFKVDAKQLKVERFRAYGEATASGENVAGAPEGNYPVVFAIVEAYDEISKAVPPLYHDISPVWRSVYRNPRVVNTNRR
jgi:hypothetical protein